MNIEQHPQWAEQERIEALMTTPGVDRFRREANEAYQAGEATKAGGARF